MAIARFENITINNLDFTVSEFGEQTTTESEWFQTRAKVQSVSNSVRVSDKYRVYSDIVEFTLNYTPNTRQIVDSQNLYSLQWKNKSWRIDNVRESDDRMSVTMTCVRNDPSVAV